MDNPRIPESREVWDYANERFDEQDARMSRWANGLAVVAGVLALLLLYLLAG
jgi:hypothetical protein